MSDYGITANDLRERLTSKELAELTTGSGSGSPDDAVIDAKVSSAEAEIHLAAGVYYATPIVATEDATSAEAAALLGGLREKVLDFAAYKLLQLRPQILNNGERSAYWSQLKKSIDAWIDAISTSNKNTRRALPAALERSVVVTLSGGADAQSDENVMNRCSLKGFR